MHIYIYIYIHIHTDAHTHIYTCMYTHTHTVMDADTYTYTVTHVWKGVQMCIYIYIYIHIYTNVHTRNTRTLIRTYICTHTHTHAHARTLKHTCDYIHMHAPKNIHARAQSARAVECTDTPTLNECPGYDTKLSDGEALVMLELWGMQSSLLLPTLPGSLESRVVAPDSVLSMGQIELNCVLMLN